MRQKLTLEQFKDQWRVARLNGITYDDLTASYFKYIQWYEVHKNDGNKLNPDPPVEPNKSDYPDYNTYRRSYLRWYDRTQRKNNQDIQTKKSVQQWYCDRGEHEKCQLRICKCECHKK